MRLEIFDSLSSCSHLKGSWNAFANECSHDISLTFEWHQALAASQSPAANLKILWVYQGGELIAILPLCRSWRRRRWVPLRTLSPLGAIYCAHDSLLIRSPSLLSLAEILETVTSSVGRWDAFSFGVSDDTNVYSQLEFADQFPARNIEWIQGKSSPYLALNGTLEDFTAKLGTKMRTNIRARLKRIQDAGSLELVVITEQADVHDAFDAIRQIEIKSWKQSAGTSITANPAQVRFYEELMRGLAASGLLRVYLLHLDGHPVAHDLGFVYKNRFFSGKTSFTEDIRPLQPGFVLRWLIIKDLFEHEISEHDFMGESEPYKLQWTRTVRHHRDVLLYRNGAVGQASKLLGRLSNLLRRNGGLATRVSDGTLERGG